MPRACSGTRVSGMMEAGGHRTGRTAFLSALPRHGWTLGCWLAACLAGSYWSMRYDFQAGSGGQPGMQGAGSSAVPRVADGPAVLAFLHPRCVCTASTVDNLVATLRRHPHAALTALIFVP